MFFSFGLLLFPLSLSVTFFASLIGLHTQVDDTWCVEGNEITYTDGAEKMTAEVIRKESKNCRIRVHTAGGSYTEKSIPLSTKASVSIGICERLRVLTKGLEFTSRDSNGKCHYKISGLTVYVYPHFNTDKHAPYLKDTPADVKKAQLQALCTTSGPVHFKKDAKAATTADPDEVMIPDQTKSVIDEDAWNCNFVLYRKETNGDFSKKTVPSSALKFDESGISFHLTWGEESAAAETVKNPFDWCKKDNEVTYHYMGKTHTETVTAAASYKDRNTVCYLTNARKIVLYLPVTIEEKPAA